MGSMINRITIFGALPCPSFVMASIVIPRMCTLFYLILFLICVDSMTWIVMDICISQ